MRRDFSCFSSLCLAAILVTVLFVYWQRELVADWPVLATLLLVLLLFSFWTSATEAAYAIVYTIGEPPRLTQDLAEEAARLTAVAREERFIADPGLLDNRKLVRLVALQSSLAAGSRDSYVGAFASASVFLNTALVAFLPVALVQNPQQRTTLRSFLAGLEGYGMRSEWHGYLSGTKWLTFVATTLSLLVLGKIVPKMVGFAYPYLFTYKLAGPARLVHFLFGWIGRGARYPLTRVL